MSKMQMNIIINRGSDAMVSKGMLARASVQLVTPDGAVMIQLDDMLIRDGKEGPWVAPPARQVEKDGKQVYYKYYRFYPENEEMRKAIEKRIIDQYNATPIPTSGGNGSARPAPAGRTANKPATYNSGARSNPAPAPKTTTAGDVGVNLDDFSFEVG